MNKIHKVRAIRSYKMWAKLKYYLIKWSNTDVKYLGTGYSDKKTLSVISLNF